MRVLHVIDTLKGGGAESVVLELLPRIAARGVDVAVLAGSESRLSADERARLGLPVLEGNKRGKLDISYPVRLIGLIRRFAPDVVHTHTFHGKYWGRFGALAAGAPVIVHTEHSSVERIAWYERPLAPYLTARTAAYVTFSDRTAALVRSREPVPELVVIPNGIEIPPDPPEAARAAARESLEIAPDGFALGMVASLLANKNHALAIDALAVLPEQLRERTSLEFFGAGPEENALRARAVNAGLGARVRFRGFRTDVRALLPALDLFLTLSFAESQPMSVLEAMGARLPVIGTPTIGARDLIDAGRSGIVLADAEPATLAGALARALDDPAWRERAGAAGRARLIAEYDIEAIADRHVALYRRLAAAAAK